MVKDTWDAFKDFVKNPITHWIILLCDSLLLFLPEKFLKKIYLDNLKEQLGLWLGIIFIFAISVIAVTVIATIYQWVKHYYNESKLTKVREESLLKLYPAEREVVIEMYTSTSRSIVLPIESTVATVLLGLKIIQRGSSVGHILTGFPYFLQPWVITYLDEHPEYYQGIRTVSEDEFRNSFYRN